MLLTVALVTERLRRAATLKLADNQEARNAVERRQRELSAKADRSGIVWPDFWDGLVPRWDVAEILPLLLSTRPEAIDMRKTSPVWALLREEEHKAAVARAEALWRATQRAGGLPGQSSVSRV